MNAGRDRSDDGKSINRYRGARFLTSAHQPGQAPADTGHEAAFIGRSNAGKSSVINALTDNRRLARISRTPGRTRLLNFFEAPGGARLVDLPGYGFARVPAQMQRHWAGLITNYLENRRSLRGVVLVTDVRRPVSDSERQALNWCHAAGRPIHVVLNKADKLASGARRSALARARDDLEHGGVQLFSATAGTGLDDLRAVLDGWLYGYRVADDEDVRQARPGPAGRH